MNKAPQARRNADYLVGTTKTASRMTNTDDQIVKYALQSAAKELAPGTRVRICMTSIVPGHDGVEVWHSPTRQKAYYKGLARCGMIWVCPLCASTITERRRDELSKLLGQTEEIFITLDNKVERIITARKWNVGLATFTLAHKRGVSLQDTLSKLSGAYRRVTTGRWFADFKRSHSVIGTIRALEVTYGENGWHPHIHTILVRQSANTPRSTADIELDLMFRWDDAVHSVGAKADKIHGVDYRAGDTSAIEYISKMGQNVVGSTARWNVVSELVKYPVKRGRKGNLTLWDLLAEYMAGDVKAGELWIEAQAALKGKRHMVPSRGLYKALGTPESALDDIMLAQEPASASDALLARLTVNEWRTIIRKNMRGQLLAIAGFGDQRALYDFLEGLL